MKFELVIKPDHLQMFGNVPCLPVKLSDEGKRFVGDASDAQLLLDDFVPALDRICPENVLDYGDVDYFDEKQCAAIREWLEGHMPGLTSFRLRRLYETLYSYVSEAVELHTGVVIEL